MKIFLFWLCLGFPVLLNAQLFDDFSDGNFTQNPSWIGDDTAWVVSAQLELQSDGNGTDEQHLVTAGFLAINGVTEWRMRARITFSPSSGNRFRVYLLSDRVGLEDSLNGYFVQLGESGSNDGVDLYRQDGDQIVRLIDGVDGLAANGFDGVLRVTRDSLGKWELFADDGSGETPQGDTTDATYTIADWFGVWVDHTSSRAKSFFFDDFYVGPPFRDTVPPQLDSLQIRTSRRLRVFFSEPVDPATATVAANYRLSPAHQGLPNLPILINPTTVELRYSSDFRNRTRYRLTVRNVTDTVGNAIAPPTDTAGFFYSVPDTVQPGELIFNEIFPDPTPSVGLPEEEFIEIYNNSNRTISLVGLTVDNGTTVGTITPADPQDLMLLEPEAYVALAQDPSAFSFLPNSAYGLSSWTSLVNGGDNLGLRDFYGNLIDTLDYERAWYGDPEKDDGGYSLERISPLGSPCGVVQNWTASNHPDGGTPGAQNSVFSLRPDSLPPRIVSVEVIAADSVRVIFNEQMNPTSIQGASSYRIDPGGIQPAQLRVTPTVDSVLLLFGDPLPVGEVYRLHVNSVADCSGNALDSLSADFALGAMPGPFDIVFTEIYPDFEPSRGLPEAEFVELYNRSDRLLTLKGVRLDDGGTPAVFPEVILFPNTYLIVTDPSDTVLYSSLGRVVGLRAAPGLNNDGDRLSLFAPDGQRIDRVDYLDDWHDNPAAAAGGFTLERIDVNFNACDIAANWRSSRHPSGGTPGRVNSVAGEFVDGEAPGIERAFLFDSQTVVLQFDEPMAAASFDDITRYRLDPGIGPPTLAFPDTDRQISLLFDRPLTVGVLYTLEVEGLADCSGNNFSATIRLARPQTPEPGDVLLTEILFNPYPGGSDFVEIVNVSGKLLDLSQLAVGEIFSNTDSIFNGFVVSEFSRLFLPGDRVALSRDTLHLVQTYAPPTDASLFEMSRFPSFDDAEGEAVVYATIDESVVVLDRFFYLDDYHLPTLADDEGVSLERISLDEPTQEASNWVSAASVVGYATPGYENSQAQSLDPGAETVFLEFDSFSPDDDGFRDALPIRYNFDFPGANVRITVFDDRGRFIYRIKENTLLGVGEGSFFWDGRDAQGTKADIGIYVILFEVENSETGERQRFRRVCALTSRF